MAIFSRQDNKDEQQAPVETTPEINLQNIVFDAKASNNLIVPRLSEKAGAAGHLNKYIFTVYGKANKVQVRKVVEKMYGVKIAQVNMITMAGKTRRFGRRTGVTSAFKKAIVTLTPDSKKITLVEPN